MTRSRKSRRINRKSRRRPRAHRGGDIVPSTTLGAAPTKSIVLKCILDKNQTIKVNSPPPDVTVTPPPAAPGPGDLNILKFSTTAKISDITFSTAAGPVNIRYLGTPTGINIISGVSTIVPRGFKAVRALTPTQKALSAAAPISGPISIKNLNMSNMGIQNLPGEFTITIVTI
jgi:hypothetical protein